MKRELWLDYSRAYACILVALGHLLMSFQGTAILEENVVASFFVDFIYYFHVYIFFFCSGYLFQVGFSKLESNKERFEKRICRCADFAVTYVIFSVITYLIKTVFSGEVNSEVNHSLLSVLFEHPINQMWYLYAMVVIMAIVPLIKSEKSLYVILSVSVIAKIITWFYGFGGFLPASYLFGNSIWFVLGMVWAYKKIRLRAWMSVAGGVVFVIMSSLSIVMEWNAAWLSGVLTLCGVIASVEIIRFLTAKKEKLSRFWHVISKYMFQIYLLHTICAAGIRIVLLKLGITNFGIHFIIGLIFSFAVPVVCAIIAEKSKILNIVFFPTNTIRTLFSREKKRKHLDI